MFEWIKLCLFIQRALIEKNQTVQGLSYDQINLEYQSFFDNFGETMKAMSTFLGYGMMLATMKAFSVYKTHQINKVRTAFTDSLNLLIRVVCKNPWTKCSS